MYGKRDANYLQEAELNPDSFLYRTICNSGPVATFRLLVEPSYDIDSVTVNRLEPVDTCWNKDCTKTLNDGTAATKRRKIQPEFREI